MALTKQNNPAEAATDSNPQNDKCSTIEGSLAEFQASMTALAIIDAFARVAAHRAVADAKGPPEGGTDRG